VPTISENSSQIPPDSPIASPGRPPGYARLWGLCPACLGRLDHARAQIHPPADWGEPVQLIQLGYRGGRQGGAKRRRAVRRPLPGLAPGWPVEAVSAQDRYCWRPGESLALYGERIAKRGRSASFPREELPSGVRRVKGHGTYQARVWLPDWGNVNLGLFHAEMWGSCDQAIRAAERAAGSFKALVIDQGMDPWEAIRQLQATRARFGRTVVPPDVLPRWAFRHPDGTYGARCFFRSGRSPILLPGPFPEAIDAHRAMADHIQARKNARQIRKESAGHAVAMA